MHPFCHTHNGVQYIASAACFIFVIEEFQIKLQHVNRKRLEHVQRGVAAAEIVHQDLESL